MSNILDPGQNVGPVLGPDCLQRLSAEDKICQLITCLLLFGLSCREIYDKDAYWLI